MFHWVRNSSLYSPAARQRQIAVRTMFRQKEINAMLKATRDTQFQQWLAVVDFLRDRRPDPATMRRLSRTLRPYGFAYRRFRPIFMPIRNMLQKHF